MYIVRLNEDSYLVSLLRQVRLWEPITAASVSPEMHLYDSGFKPTKEFNKATPFYSLEELNKILNNEAIQILYPDAKVEEV
jgi:hypothetical protein